MQHRNQDEIKQDIEPLRGDSDVHAEPLLPADTQIVVDRKIHRNQRAEQGINFQVLRSERNGILRRPGGDDC